MMMMIQKPEIVMQKYRKVTNDNTLIKYSIKIYCNKNVGTFREKKSLLMTFKEHFERRLVYETKKRIQVKVVQIAPGFN